MHEKLTEQQSQILGELKLGGQQESREIADKMGKNRGDIWMDLVALNELGYVMRTNNVPAFNTEFGVTMWSALGE